LCVFFSERLWEWTWAPFRMDFEMILGPAGCPESEKGQAGDLNGNRCTKKRREAFRACSSNSGGPLKLVSSILQGTPQDILSLHFVPQMHGGRCIYIYIYTYIHIYIYIYICIIYVYIYIMQVCRQNDNHVQETYMPRKREGEGERATFIYPLDSWTVCFGVCCMPLG
jgi:hypothetical protein